MNGKKKGLIIVNAYSNLTSSLNQSKRLKEEFLKLNVEIDVVRNNEFICGIKDSKVICNALDYDFCVYLDKDKYVSSMLEKAGIKLFNSHDAIRVCDDKMETYIALANNNIPIVDTFSGMLCYTSGSKISSSSLDKIESALGYPVVVKKSYGSLGSGVYKADNRSQLQDLANALINEPHVFQKFVKTSQGKDTRIIVIGGKVVAQMNRISNGDFRSNIELGGRGEITELSKEYKEIAEKTAKCLGLDYCGIDVLQGETSPLICEVNSNAFFGGIESVTGVNVAKLYAEHILNSI